MWIFCWNRGNICVIPGIFVETRNLMMKSVNILLELRKYLCNSGNICVIPEIFVEIAEYFDEIAEIFVEIAEIFV